MLIIYCCFLLSFCFLFYDIYATIFCDGLRVVSKRRKNNERKKEVLNDILIVGEKQ
jgi:hypothetical protein